VREENFFNDPALLVIPLGFINKKEAVFYVEKQARSLFFQHRRQPHKAVSGGLPGGMKKILCVFLYGIFSACRMYMPSRYLPAVFSGSRIDMQVSPGR